MSTKNSTPSPTPTKTARTCSQCGNNGHNSRTCMETGATATVTNTNSFMLFGVRLTEGGGGGGGGNIVSSSAFRKSASMTNLSQFEQPQQDSNPDISAGYASDDALHVPGRGRERKRGIQWTEEEHKLFLVGLQTVGKGDWRGIARKFVKTRTPTQVASHAQKYFLRRANLNRRRRRSSLFDITTDTVVASSIEEQLNIQLTDREGIEALKLGQKFQAEASPTNLVRPRPILPLPPSANMAHLNLNQSPSSSADAVDHMTLSLTPSTSTSQSNEQSPGGRHSSAMGRFTGGSGDSIISVA